MNKDVSSEESPEEDVGAAGAVEEAPKDSAESGALAGGEAAEAPPIEDYVNPEFFTPKELSQMIAGFGVQVYVAMKARNDAYSHREAIHEAVILASMAIDDKAIGTIFEKVTERNGFATNVMEVSRRRLKEMMEQQAADAAAAAEAGGA